MSAIRSLFSTVNDLGYEELEVRKRQRRNAACVFAGSIALILFLGLLGSSEIPAVLLLYTSVLFAGFAVIGLILLSEDPKYHSGNSIWGSLFARKLSEGTSTSFLVEGSDFANSFYVYVKYASRGSVYSRKEIAFLLRSVYENTSQNDDSDILRKTNPQLWIDLSTVYYPYLRDSRANQTDNASIEPRKSTAKERDAYLASLDRVIKNISESTGRRPRPFQ